MEPGDFIGIHDCRCGLGYRPGLLSPMIRGLGYYLPVPDLPYAWKGDVETFLRTSEEEVFQELTRFSRETGAPQLVAWDRTIGKLRRALAGCMPQAAGFGLVLEYELPRSGGRRPDLIVLENGIVLVIEFKNRVVEEPGDLKQVRDYVRDLKLYHAACHEKTLVPVLIPIGMTGEAYEREGVQVVPPPVLAAWIREVARVGTGRQGDLEGFVRSRYEPLPALVDAARLLFEKQPLPRIKQAESAQIPETVQLIESTIASVHERRGRTLILLSGVPGSGKTLVGLQVAHSRLIETPSVFLSGNGPLVQVLQYVLDSKVFVQDLRSYVLTHCQMSSSEPVRERVIVFDEAQRAWDRDKVRDSKSYRGKLLGSQPELLVRLAGRIEDGFVLVALLGEGQEIHSGEESGIGLWVEALQASPGWDVMGPPHYAEVFRRGGLSYQAKDRLNLTTSLRSHKAAEIALWAGLLLDGKLTEAAKVAANLYEDGFTIVASRNLDALRGFVRSTYEGHSSSRYGILASSKLRSLKRDFGIECASQRFFYYGQWYEESRDNPRSCCQLNLALTEFGCQGLELDMPLVCWGPDLVWTGQRWEERLKRSGKVRDPRRLRLNAYRVLLTRGRDGMALFIPPGLDGSYEALLSAGVRPLS